MLSTILNNFPCTKCVVIYSANLETPAEMMFTSILKHHLLLNNYDVHCLTNESVPKKVLNLSNNEKFHLYNCMSKVNSWINTTDPDGLELLKSNLSGVVAVYSLVPFLYEYNVKEIYKILHDLMQRKNIVQIVLVIQTDILELHQSYVVKYFDYLSTLSIKFIQIEGRNPRVQYKYKKSPYKVTNQIEEYIFKEGLLHSKPIEIILPNVDNTEEIAENMSTFKIGLNENERKSRAELILPYMKHLHSSQKEEGKITYNFDEIDDWDEEDPDDDLNI